MQNKYLFFISGASGVGKTSVLPYLKELLPNSFKIYDFDDRGVPKNVDKLWRQNETRHWEDIAKQNLQSNYKTIVCGLSQPDEITNLEDVSFILLDADDEIIKQRLEQRYADVDKVESLKKVTGLMPEGFIKDNLNHAQAFREMCKQYQCRIVDTSKLSPKEVATKLVDEYLIK